MPHTFDEAGDTVLARVAAPNTFRGGLDGTSHAELLTVHDAHGNPAVYGPTDTGWATSQQEAFVRSHTPRGRWNAPEEAADIVALLLTREAATITGPGPGRRSRFRRFTS